MTTIQITAHEKWDAKKTYKMNTGYFGGVATIGNMIVYYENRDGNANVKLCQAETLLRAYKILLDHAIKIRNARMDAGSYSKEIIETVAAKKYLPFSYLFYRIVSHIILQTTNFWACGFKELKNNM
ncbi:hypothetical protein FACS1894201_00460 [Bacteroidia bacterium]|nr:hypothetical protein FACS1894201_00460 [Bacteroidia bacterium]